MSHLRDRGSRDGRERSAAADRWEDLLKFQVTIDCADPHALAAFYSGADIGWAAEDHDASVTRLLDAGLIESADVVTVDGRRAFGDFASCLDISGALPRLHFQRVPERKQAKNRVHFDLQFHSDAAARDAAVARMVELGARKIGQGAQGPRTHG